ncbi:MAG: exopolysaccharide Pel transporter PelG [Aquificaceae bacterium]
MAGISFELRRTLKKGTITAIFKAFGYSLALSSGPYIITILSLIVSSLFYYKTIGDKTPITAFQVSVTYLMAFSLIYSGFGQLVFTRYIADRIFERQYYRLMPNLLGLLTIFMTSAFLISLPLSVYFFAKEAGYVYSLIFSLTFTVLVGLWLVNIVLIGLKRYRFVLLSFAIAYLGFFFLGHVLSIHGLKGLMFSFFLSQSLLFLMLLSYYIYNNLSDKIVEFDFLNKNRIFPSLIFAGFFYNLAIWVDKFVFWFNKETSIQALGPLRYSIVYDIPMFLAYLAIAPGMAALFIKIEVEFSYWYQRYYDAIINGLSLRKIYNYGDELIESARSALFEIARVQGIFNIFLILLEEPLFSLFNLPLVYIPLFHVLLFGTYFQLLLMSVIAMLFYFDRRKEALTTVFAFFAFNLLLSQITIILGPYYYGYGFVLSTFISFLIAIIFLRRFLHGIHYYTFMFV